MRTTRIAYAHSSGAIAIHIEMQSKAQAVQLHTWTKSTLSVLTAASSSMALSIVKADASSVHLTRQNKIIVSLTA